MVWLIQSHNVFNRYKYLYEISMDVQADGFSLTWMNDDLCHIPCTRCGSNKLKKRWSVNLVTLTMTSTLWWVTRRVLYYICMSHLASPFLQKSIKKISRAFFVRLTTSTVVLKESVCVSVCLTPIVHKFIMPKILSLFSNILDLWQPPCCPEGEDYCGLSDTCSDCTTVPIHS